METIATFRTYADARHAAGHLAGRGFPAARLVVVGSDLTVVRRCVGRWTAWHALATGSVVGAAAGLPLGGVLTLVVGGVVGSAAVLAWTAGWGAVLGAALGTFAHASAGGTRCVFTPARITPGEYELQADQEWAEHARMLLTAPRPPALLEPL